LAGLISEIVVTADDNIGLLFTDKVKGLPGMSEKRVPSATGMVTCRVLFENVVLLFISSRYTIPKLFKKSVRYSYHSCDGLVEFLESSAKLVILELLQE